LPRLQTGRRDPAVVRYHVARLRARLGCNSHLIENVRGCGYRLRCLSGLLPAAIDRAPAAHVPPQLDEPAFPRRSDLGHQR